MSFPGNLSSTAIGERESKRRSANRAVDSRSPIGSRTSFAGMTIGITRKPSHQVRDSFALRASQSSGPVVVEGSSSGTGQLEAGHGQGKVIMRAERGLLV